MFLSRFRNLIRILPTQQTRCLSTSMEEEASAQETPLRSRDRVFEDVRLEQFECLYQGNPEKRDQIEQILVEYEFTKYNELGRVPSRIEIADMERLLDEAHSADQRQGLFLYMFKREMAKRAGKEKIEKLKEEARLRREERMKAFAEREAPRTGLLDNKGEILYGLWHNNLLCRISQGQIKSGNSSSRLRTAALFGRKLIFDFGYEQYMNRQQAHNSVDQIQEAYGLNRFKYTEPFDLWFCNFDRESFTGQYISQRAITNLFTGSMITVKEDCFTNHFNKDQLVYLSPHAREPLNNQVHKSDDIYIIGMFNDKGNQQPVSYRKAMKLGIRARSLPLDQHVTFLTSKSLCMNHVTGIMLEVISNGGDWHAAFKKHIPVRKLKSNEQLLSEEADRQKRWMHLKRRKPFTLPDLD